MNNIDMFSIFSKMFAPVISLVWQIVLFVVFSAIFCIIAFFTVFFIKYKINPFSVSSSRLFRLKIKFRPYDLLRWLLYDFLTRKERKGRFKEFGFSIFCGRQGSGKTISMVDYLNVMHEKFPNLKIVTNFAYIHADKQMTDWRDLLEFRNGEDGVIFAIDEIHSEYSSESWKDFPENLLSEISQQRKQRVKIIASSQVFSRVAKPIREQSFSVFCCSTLFNRITFVKEYDACEYSTSDTPYLVKKKCKPISKRWYVQSNKLRECYDTYEKVERMKKVQFIPRSERH